MTRSTDSSAAGSSASSTDPPADLAPRLRRVPARELHELIGEHLRRFTLAEVRQVLRNPHVDAEAIESLAAARHLTSGYAMRCCLARHHRTPSVLAQQFIPGLFWRDLMEITVDTRIHPSVRQVAESYLLKRLTRLAVGEKMSLARRAGHGVLAHLRHDPNPPVIEALLENPRLTEELLVPLAAESRSPRVLDLLAHNPSWGPRYALRAALAKNPHAPFGAVLPILPTLLRGDLADVAGVEDHSSLIRRRAEGLLEEEQSLSASAANGTPDESAGGSTAETADPTTASTDSGPVADVWEIDVADDDSIREFLRVEGDLTGGPTGR